MSFILCFSAFVSRTESKVNVAYPTIWGRSVVVNPEVGSAYPMSKTVDEAPVRKESIDILGDRVIGVVSPQTIEFRNRFV